MDEKDCNLDKKDWWEFLSCVWLARMRRIIKGMVYLTESEKHKIGVSRESWETLVYIYICLMDIYPLLCRKPWVYLYLLLYRNPEYIYPLL